MSTMTEAAERHLKEADRCDRCGAQAFVHVELTEGMLLFCGHDYAKYEAKLEAVALAVIDERDFINKSPAPSTTTH